MTIRPGDQWGVVQEAPESTKWFRCEADLGHWMSIGQSAEYFGLTGGDLCVITGSTQRTLFVPIDILEVRFQKEGSSTDERIIALSSVVLGSWWNKEALTAISNTGLVRGVEWFARSHPNDGVVEFAELSEHMSRRQKMMARSRIMRGAAYAHPQISLTSTTSWEWSGRPRRLEIDGRNLGRVVSVKLTLQPDALRVYLGKPSTGAEG